MKTVLPVDDHNTILLGLGVRLKSMDHTVYTAKDAVNAASAVRKSEPAATSLADAVETALSPGDNWRPSIAV